MKNSIGLHLGDPDRQTPEDIVPPAFLAEWQAQNKGG